MLQAGWTSSLQPQGIIASSTKPRVLLYTMFGVLSCQHYLRQCIAQTCSVEADQWDEHLQVHASTSMTCAGDELAYHFQDLMFSKGGLTFSYFCQLMTNKYKRIAVHSRPFMHHTTFINWRI